MASALPAIVALRYHFFASCRSWLGSPAALVHHAQSVHRPNVFQPVGEENEVTANLPQLALGLVRQG